MPLDICGESQPVLLSLEVVQNGGYVIVAGACCDEMAILVIAEREP